MSDPDHVTTTTPAPQGSDASPQTEIALLRRRLKSQQLLSDISTQFIDLPVEGIDGHINQALGRVACFLGFNLAAIAKFSGQGIAGEVTHIWTAQGLPPTPPGFTELDFPWLAARLTQGHPVHLACLNDLPPAGQRDRQTYDRLGIRSAYNWPLQVGGATVGCLCFASVANARPFPTEFEQELRLLAQVMASALARARADQALRESEERLNLAADAAAAGLWSLNLATNCFWLTTKTQELFGFAADEEVTFERFLSAVHPEDRELLRQTVQELVHSNNEGQVEYRVVPPGDGVRWMLSRGRVRAGRAGESPSLMGISLDITERRRSEQAFRTSEARLASGAELAGLGFYEVADGERVTYLDERARAIIDAPPGGTDDRGTVAFWFEHIHPDDRPRILDAHNRLNDGTVDRLAVEYRYLHSQRGLMWIDHLASVLGRNDAARATHTIGVLRDITEQRRTEMEALELRSKLAHSGRVTLLGQLASALAHELSQPLGAILRNAEAAELMLQEPAPDLVELRAIVADILSDDQRAGKVIDRLRSLLKRRSLDLQPVELDGVIAEVLSLVRTDAAARHVKLASAAAPELPRVRGDRVHLQQVLLNLLVNAMDALAGVATNDRCIRVSARQAEASMVEVRVCDDGPGIPGDSPERLFEPFFTTKPNGMGMGLAVSKTILEAHHGRIWAENRPEGGACFCFTVPVARGEGRGA